MGHALDVLHSKKKIGLGDSLNDRECFYPLLTRNSAVGNDQQRRAQSSRGCVEYRRPFGCGSRQTRTDTAGHSRSDRPRLEEVETADRGLRHVLPEARY